MLKACLFEGICVKSTFIWFILLNEFVLSFLEDDSNAER